MTDTSAIFIIVPTADVTSITSELNYVPASLNSEGFIHACEYHQVAEVVSRFFDNHLALSVLVVDVSLINSPLRYEAPSITMSSPALFPHIYGALNTDAIVDVCDLVHFKHQPITPEIMAVLRHYRFERLPVESTLFKSTWRSSSNNTHGEPVGTAMIGLYCDSLTSVSCFHKLTFDEVWHFYGGDPLELTLLYPNGDSEQVVLGTDFTNGQVCQYLIPAGVWQGGCLVKGGQYALFGCTMAPGFTGSCFTAGIADALIEAYPNEQKVIKKLSVNGHQTTMPEGFAT
ncbi:cupin domain-containing protein [Pseudoalteromonas sp. MMG013]|uniref:cupin domain-containing protein n=1 Tax=Pseudoalteromonas sp. MMG013 TaxID=2822687 RepID=UPI001B35C15A|nr:cupin domain-containing protein [Pseudoalteromonas sp. MMG013]MBQ4862298.1 cupin domain-containing protein [Pseudoalteromonas sp. MMG013]